MYKVLLFLWPGKGQKKFSGPEGFWTTVSFILTDGKVQPGSQSVKTMKNKYEIFMKPLDFGNFCID